MSKPPIAVAMNRAAPAVLVPGMVVECERVQAGLRRMGTARAVVLSRFGQDSTAPYVVWFYDAEGPARLGDDATVSLTFPREITHFWPLSALSEKSLRRIVAGAHGFDAAAGVRRQAGEALEHKRVQRRR
ncbi:DUF6409 family protein [Kitasatospora purpeofusca]|uniref:DUF6409 family protein n=1 Tax=Kitasatospora purpeofusca TaxID=67352 RepID=UPI0035D8F3FC